MKTMLFAAACALCAAAPAFAADAEAAASVGEVVVTGRAGSLAELA